MAMEVAMAVDHKCGDEGSAECKAAKKKQEEFKTVIEANCKVCHDEAEANAEEITA